ncbi:hypothetical protein [Streptomyces indicus]|uniref:Uncharacterized protein n=1 Tax=Streptomyces indicus TaxID=417292 RepID=A0A1G8TI39_9ACTN|nr:hypothetical protein [Streptomyces indicus]SDJ40585.1 hypothetical protein SAMN05421806_101253 [Streptomyces indicus]
MSREAATHSVRSAELNEQIRALWARAGGRLDEQQRAEYERLVTAWAAAVRGDVTEPV